jgi:hypothetical protein
MRLWYFGAVVAQWRLWGVWWRPYFIGISREHPWPVDSEAGKASAIPPTNETETV